MLNRAFGAAFAATIALAATPPAPAVAQANATAMPAQEQDDALSRLFEMARTGQGDPHLPYVLDRLKRALSAQDLLGFLKLVDTQHFNMHFGRMRATDPSPGDALDRFTCAFFSVCDVSKEYSFNDIVSGNVLSVSPESGLADTVVAVQLELNMWDGVSLTSEILYDPSSARLSTAPR